VRDAVRTKFVSGEQSVGARPNTWALINVGAVHSVVYQLEEADLEGGSVPNPRKLARGSADDREVAALERHVGSGIRAAVRRHERMFG
jgi:hypothetical protein